MGRIRPTFCNHYRAMSDHDTCEVGVPYSTFEGMDFKKRPCFRDRGESPRPGCDKAEHATPEQIAEYERLMNERFERLGKCRQAIVAHLGGPWKKGAPGASGTIKCPNCDGELSFSRAGYNGHINARCSTNGCACWME